MRSLAYAALILLIVGGINWGLIGLIDENVIANVIDDGTVLDIIYIAVGVAALVSIPTLSRVR